MTIRASILRFHATYLGLASVLGFFALDLRGILFGTGPEGQILGSTPYLAIGFIEAHGLALILSVLFWNATPTRAWHLTGAATAALLGICNVVFWDIFTTTDALALGYVATGLHLGVAALELGAASTAGRPAVAGPDCGPQAIPTRS